MDAQQALADLTEISSQIRAAVVFDQNGKVAGSTVGDGAALARAASELLATAEQLRTGDSPLIQLEVATGDGSVFVVREGKTWIAATTGSDPTVGLVFYDLKSALRSVKRATPPKKPAAPRRKTAAAPKPASKKKPAPRRKKSDAS
jgi:predicted regulator of Ras-like GTPase activity (Roadblock/LC7/MglB family)